MYWHYHNDNEDGRKWTSGRVWLNRSNYERRSGWLKCSALSLEWAMPPSVCGWGVSFGAGDSGRNLMLHGSIPFLVTIYFTIEDVFPMYFFGTDFDRGHDREITVSFYDWSFRYHLWVGSMASWSRDYPWCRWWRQGHFDFGSLLGPWVASHYTERKESVVIPMPEGIYKGTATVERWSRGRRFWFKHRTTEVWLDIPKGIPHAGKGENSWDCGDDGLFGIGGDTVEGAIGNAVALVLRDRRRYGHASEKAVAEALG